MNKLDSGLIAKAFLIWQVHKLDSGEDGDLVVRNHEHGKAGAWESWGDGSAPTGFHQSQVVLAARYALGMASEAASLLHNHA